MSWLTDLVRPKIATRTKREVPTNIWEKCPSCGEMIYQKELAERLGVCPSCRHHLRISVDARLAYLLDAGSAKEIEVPLPAKDPLKFRDLKRYNDRIKDAVKTTGRKDAFYVARTKIGGTPCIVCVFDFAFMAGSMGTAVGEAVVAAAEAALKHNLPLLAIPASGGARMQEGILSLMQMARTTAALQKLKEARLPYFVLLTDPTTGGVTASFAMLGDITLAEPGALIGFAGPRVIQQTIGETLPQGFQTAEYLLDKGMVDVIVSRQEQPQVIGRLMSQLMAGNRA
ncbi:MAG: acetyl-CoA carboxylase carboxyltransferase subunit beta [Proteobacteria bacterium]|nr:acetyl-CoA carboxylase carboxyltransferase subunit beta [Pseudomonadota bacterium]